MRNQGVNVIEMNFLPDVYVQCDVCKGARFNRETLQVKYKGFNISDVLEMTVEQAAETFCFLKLLIDCLRWLMWVSICQIGTAQHYQAEAQNKVQLNYRKRLLEKLLLIDEPTTGLSFYDVHKLMDVIQRLVDKGNSVIVIEHNLDVIRCSDWIIDLGPDGGDKGGEIIVENS